MLTTYPLDPRWTHAGAVAFRKRAGALEILLVRARPEPHDWVLPKGHIERGEAPHDCARREIREEGAVDAEPIAFLGDDHFTTPAGKEVNVAFFLMRYLQDVPPEEDRPRRWCTFKEAPALIRFESGRGIIQAAEAYLTRAR